jgi:hypothetical protein
VTTRGDRGSSWAQEVAEAVDRVLTGLVKGGDSDWKLLGRSSRPPGDDSGWLTLDLRSGVRAPSADSFDQLCLGDEEGPDNGVSFPVERVRIADGVLKIKVSGAVPANCDHVWTVRLTPRHLWQKLREGVLALDRTPLADKLAAGRLDPLSSGPASDHPPGFLPRQQAAYRACVEPGLHAVWGPPGTGKTRVLSRAIEDLVKDGKRVLLVSTANIAVDNALKEVVKHLPTDQGQVIRVGPPHLPELAADDDVQLQRLAARATAEVDAELSVVQERLVALERIDTRIEELDEALVRYDHAAHHRAVQRIRRRDELASLMTTLDDAAERCTEADRTFSVARAEVDVAKAEQGRIHPQRVQLQQLAELREQLVVVERKFTTMRMELATAHLGLQRATGLIARRRAKKKFVAVQKNLADAEVRAVNRRRFLEGQVRAIEANVVITPDYVVAVDRRVALAQSVRDRAHEQLAAANASLRQAKAEHARLEQMGIATEVDDAAVREALALDLPAQHVERDRLHALQRHGRRGRPRLENRLRELNKQATKLRRDAEGEIVERARVVATTLARSRAHPAVARQRFDVVLVDEAGAAMLAEVLLVVGRATRTAVLLGDFLQLGPVTGDIDRIDDEGVRKWVKPDGFTHCGISSHVDVVDNPGAVALLQQFRFGPELRELANDVIYDVLEDGVVDGVPQRHTEIVIVDVSGLPDLSVVHRTSRYAGWWPVGALLAKVLAEHHVAEGGDVGVVTTFKQQAEATLSVLQDAGQNVTVPVGTAHSFQGREFDTVIFDLVEDGQGWISSGKLNASDFEYAAVRLFGVAITRARHRLYLIVNSRTAVRGARGGTPLGAVGKLAKAGRIQWVRAGALLGLDDTAEFRPVSRIEAELSGLLRGLVDVTDVDDEFSFKETLRRSISTARRSVWMWAPWVGKQGAPFIPLIADAVARGVDVRVFTRDDKDFIQKRPGNQKWIEELKGTGARLIRSWVEHKKIVVIDRRTVLIGSHNPLSQHLSREIMLTCRGAAFAKRLLAELRADEFIDPPVCPRCRVQRELRRSSDRKRGMPYFWRCPSCKDDTEVPAVENSTR